MTGGDPLATWRNIPLDEVAIALGYRRDPTDRARFKRDGSVISINGAKFFDHLRGTGGGGAIDLVIHATRMPLPGCAPLPRRPSREGKRRRHPYRRSPPAAAKAQPPRMAGRSATPSSVNGPCAPMCIEACQRRGLLHADDRLNAVFICRDANGQPTGAEILGTAPQAGRRRFRAMAPGSNKARGGFWLPCDHNQPALVILTESAVDATLRTKPPNPGKHVSTAPSSSQPQASQAPSLPGSKSGNPNTSSVPTTPTAPATTPHIVSTSTTEGDKAAPQRRQGLERNAGALTIRRKIPPLMRFAQVIRNRHQIIRKLHHQLPNARSPARITPGKGD